MLDQEGEAYVGRNVDVKVERNEVEPPSGKVMAAMRGDLSGRGSIY